MLLGIYTNEVKMKICPHKNLNRDFIAVLFIIANIETIKMSFSG